MTKVKPTPYVPPVLENTKDKAEPLDWEAFQLGECYLNYLSTEAIPEDAPKRTWGLLKLTTIASIPLWFVLSWKPLQTITGVEFFGLTLLLAAVCAGIYFVVTPTKDLREAPPWNTMLALLLLPLILWLAIVLAPLLAHPLEASSFLALVAMPLLGWQLDRQGMHTVYWMTAHPPLALSTLIGWRQDWAQRFFAPPPRAPRNPELTPAQQELHAKVMRVRQGYLDGVLCLAVCLGVLPMAVAWLSADLHPSQIGIRVAVTLTGSLALAAVYRNAFLPGGFTQFLNSLSNFLFQGSPGRYPPWTFQSPIGISDKRALLLVAAFFTLNVALLTSVNFFQWIYFNDFTIEHLPTPFVESLEGKRHQVAVAAVLTVGEANFFLVACFMVQIIACILFPTLVFLLAGAVVLGPALAAHHAALLGPDAYEPDRTLSPFDCYASRLVDSPNPIERESLFVGRHPALDYPILLHRELLFEHTHILGGTGTGKTALGLTTHVLQLIRRRDGAVVIIDCKGDKALFHTARIEAKNAGKKFRWFTNKQGLSTYAFNPFDRETLQHLSLEESVGLLLNSLNLHHGDDYGRAWFSMASRILVKAAFDQTLPPDARPHARRDRLPHGLTGNKQQPPGSFRQLNELLFALMADSKEFEAAKHVAYLVETLADFDQLNLTPTDDTPHPALEHAIHMPRALQNNEVIYFYLQGAMDSSTVSEIGRLAIYSLLSACILHKEKTGKSANAYCICDEAQLIVAKNIENVLAQARSYGLAFMLAHQSMSQLNPPGGTDLRELVISCTCVKQIFSARDPWMQKYLSEVSGRVRYASLSYDQYSSHIADGFLGIAFADEMLGKPGVRVSEAIGPRLTPQDIQDVSRHENLSILGVERMKGYTCLQGYSTIYADWVMPKEIYQERTDNLPWPESTEEHLVIESLWPDANTQTVQPVEEVDDEEVQDDFRSLLED